jgi:hypothetical protein
VSAVIETKPVQVAEVPCASNPRGRCAVLVRVIVERAGPYSSERVRNIGSIWTECPGAPVTRAEHEALEARILLESPECVVAVRALRKHLAKEVYPAVRPPLGHLQAFVNKILARHLPKGA